MTGKMGVICLYIVAVVFHTAMVIVGSTYTDGMTPESDCKLQACHYLRVAGGFMLTLDIMEILCQCLFGCKNEEDDRKGHICGLINVVGCSVIFIWGSAIVFGPYQEWVYDEAHRDSEKYCSYTPYMFSFVVLIIGWCFTAIRLILICLALCFCMLDSVVGDN